MIVFGIELLPDNGILHTFLASFCGQPIASLICQNIFFLFLDLVRTRRTPLCYRLFLYITLRDHLQCSWTIFFRIIIQVIAFLNLVHIVSNKTLALSQYVTENYSIVSHIFSVWKTLPWTKRVPTEMRLIYRMKTIVLLRKSTSI